MRDAFICDAIRTPVGRYGGQLSSIRTDDLATIPLKFIMQRNPGVDWLELNDVILGCANQSGEDNRNVARMALLLAGLPEAVPGVTLNRLCGSGLDAAGSAARAIWTGEADLLIAGGVESMSRSPFVLEKASTPFSRSVKMYDTTIGWRFVNPDFDRRFGTESMMETAENIAVDFRITREEQDLFALHSQEKALAAQAQGLLAKEIVPVSVPQPKNEALVVELDEHPRSTSLEKLAALKSLTGKEGTITAGNSSGVNDGAAALLIASEKAVKKFGLTPKAVIRGMQAAGVAPRVMGLGPVPATEKLLGRLDVSLDDLDLIEINEAFAAQVLGCLNQLKLKSDDPRLNRWGGAIALGHPLGMSGARLIVTAVNQLQACNLSKALCTMCIGVGQGIAMIIESI